MPSKRRDAAAGSVTITDLAREAGVSKSTVSLVLHDSPLIRAETAGRVIPRHRRYALLDRFCLERALVVENVHERE